MPAAKLTTPNQNAIRRLRRTLTRNASTHAGAPIEQVLDVRQALLGEEAPRRRIGRMRQHHACRVPALQHHLPNGDTA